MLVVLFSSIDKQYGKGFILDVHHLLSAKLSACFIFIAARLSAQNTGLILFQTIPNSHIRCTIKTITGQQGNRII